MTDTPTLPTGTLWEYPDARDVIHRGTYRRSWDFGGTDVPYAFDSACGAFVMVSGARLRAARTLGAVTAEGYRCPHIQPSRQDG